MRFAQLLEQYIGFRTLEEVSRLCEEQGVKIAPSYLSRLRSGSRPAPDDERLVRTLAEVCGGDPESLVFLAQLERRPHDAYRDILVTAFDALWEGISNQSFQQKHVAEAIRMIKSGGSLEAFVAYLDPVLGEFSTRMDANIYKARVIAEMSRRFGIDLTKGDPGESQQGSVPRPNADGTTVRLGLSEDALIKELASKSGVPEVGIVAAIAALKAVSKAE